jgi:hypothetical protein
MAKNCDIKDIREHIDIINTELGVIKQDMATIKANWNWMRWIIGTNVGLWVFVLGVLLKHGI